MNKIVNYIEKSQDVRVDRALADLLDSSELPFKLSAIRANSNVMAGNTLSRIMCKAAGEIRQMQNAAALERIRAPESTVAAEELITAAREAPQAEVELVTASVMAERLEAEGLADAIPDADAEGGVPKNEGVAEITSESIGAADDIRLEIDRSGMDTTEVPDGFIQIETSDAVRTAIADCVAAEACAVPSVLRQSEMQTHRTSAVVPSHGSSPMTTAVEAAAPEDAQGSDRIRTITAEPYPTDGSTMHRET